MIDDVDVIRVLKELPNLQLLNIAGCRKLTSTGLDVIEPTVGECIHSRRLAAAFHPGGCDCIRCSAHISPAKDITQGAKSCLVVVP